MSLEVFKRRLSDHLKLNLELVVNENRSTMLNLLEKSRNKVRLSMHKMFLDAPDEVIAAIAHYVRGTTPKLYTPNLILRGFIQKNLPRFDCSHVLHSKELVTVGKVYDIQKIYDEVNEVYFDNSLKLNLTWYGARGRRNRVRVTFGQYYDSLRLVKIHRLLDDPFFPDFFVSFVMYHEMLHSVVPGYVDTNGRFRTHGEDFKKREQQFAHYERATLWEKKYRLHFFR